MKSSSNFRVAVCHVASLYFDTNACLQKAMSCVREAAKKGAELIVFPEGFLSGYPVWRGIAAPDHERLLHDRISACAVTIDGLEIIQLCMLARELEVFISMGINEVTAFNTHYIWNTNLLIGDDGCILSRHRKFNVESRIEHSWKSGDGSSFCVCPTRLARIGVLVGSENQSPLAQYSLRTQAENLHISTFSPLPKLASPHSYFKDVQVTTLLDAAKYAQSGELFNIVSGGLLTANVIDTLSCDDINMRQLLLESEQSVAVVMGPDGKNLSQVLCGEEGILYADIDLASVSGVVLSSLKNEIPICPSIWNLQVDRDVSTSWESSDIPAFDVKRDQLKSCLPQYQVIRRLAV